MERRIVSNRIRTPDGTILVSYHVHDYKIHTDKNGLQYMVDGGNEYLRRNIHKEAPYEELSVYSDAPFEEIRQVYCRGGRGKDNKQPLTWVPIAKMSDEWLEACIVYNNERDNEGCFANFMYVKELDYRKENNIKIEDKEEVYDSTKDTQKHIEKVAFYLEEYADILDNRGLVHDASKLVPPEKEYFDKYTPRLATLTFGTPEYTQNVQDLKPALEHHYKNNSHHPQYYENGINGMNLFDIIEMFADWKASGERGKDGSIYKSIDINAERFGISKQLRSILINTAKYLEYE